MIFAVAGVDEIAARSFLAIAVVLVVARVMGTLARRVGQPAVVGEIIGGILLGPTLVGAFAGGAIEEALFPPDIRPYLGVIAELGLIIFMFIVGLELDLRLIKGKEQVAGVVSASSIALPFGLGLILATALFGAHDVVAGETIDFWPFALFIGASLSVTAFPVLARILTERGMHRTDVGVLTLACAAVDDILAWSLLALVVAVLEAGSVLDLPRTLGLSVAYVVVMFVVVKPRLASLVPRYRAAGTLTPELMAVVLVGVLVSSFITWWIGIHAIFGAFLFGIIMPRQDAADLHRDLLERLETISVRLLLPVFFIVTGLSVNIRAIGIAGLWQFALILLVACVGKFVGASAAARAQGLPSRKAAAIGVLMNTRGLTELVILNIGLAAGVLTDDLFTLLVLMALVTTVMTTPLLRLVYPDAILKRDIEAAERAALGDHDRFRILVPLVHDIDSAASRAAIAAAVDVAGGDRSEVVLARFMPGPTLELGTGLGVELTTMADTMAELQRVTADAKARGVVTVIRSQFSDEPVAGVLDALDAIDADLIVVPDTPLDDRLLATSSFIHSLAVAADVVVVRAGPAPVDEPAVTHLAVEGTPGDAAATEVALRLARGRGDRIEVWTGSAGGRRAARSSEQILRALLEQGVIATAETGARPQAGPVVFAGSPSDADTTTSSVAPAGTTTLLVIPRAELAPISLHDRLARIEATPPIAESPPTSSTPDNLRGEPT